MRLFFIWLFITILSACNAQEVDIKPFIKAWKITGVGQSRAAQTFYDSLKLNRDTTYFKNIVKALHQYLGRNNDRRLKVRTMMYEALGAREYELLSKEQKTGMAMAAIKLAHPLKDEQLNAELYALYADMFVTPYDYILYNLKAIEIQRKIGFNHFVYVQNRFFGVSDVLFRTGDYRRSIDYGKEGLGFWNVDVHHWDRRIYIVQMDILGACYNKLEKYDSSFYYYQKIYDAVLANPLPDTTLQKIWLGIAKGNIGRHLARNGDYIKAVPLMREYLENSTAVNDPFNIAIAQNELGQVFFDQHQYEPAREAWWQALQISRRENFQDQAMRACYGIASIYRVKANTDSAFFYYDLYHQSKERLQELFRESSYTNVSARMAFDNLQRSFDQAEFKMARIRNMRNAIIAGIVLLTIIAVLLYNRKRLKETIRLQEVQQKYRSAQTEAEAAKEQILLFQKSVAQKEKVIRAFSLQNDTKSVERKKELETSLEQFTLVNDDDWNAFRTQFTKAYPAFTTKLRQKAENITAAEEKLSILIFLQLNNTALASTLGISKESVARAKRRLKTRFSLGSTESLEDFIARM